MMVKHLDELHLPTLKTKNAFTIDDHLASIIEDPNDEVNVYKNKK